MAGVFLDGAVNLGKVPSRRIVILSFPFSISGR
jgi:hypothetical protein